MLFINTQSQRVRSVQCAIWAFLRPELIRTSFVSDQLTFLISIARLCCVQTTLPRLSNALITEIIVSRLFNSRSRTLTL